MKVIFCRFDTRMKRRETGYRIEKILYITFIVTFFLMVVVQAAILNPDIRTFLAINDELEGAPLSAEEFLYNKGTLVLKLSYGEINENLKVLVNGDEVARFNTGSISINVKDGDIVEIDASEVQDDTEVIVASQSDNINRDSYNMRVTVNSNIKKLVQVQME